MERAALWISGRALRGLNLGFASIEIRNGPAIIRVAGPTGPFSFLYEFEIASQNMCSNYFLNILDS